ncbi:MAG TPA: DUF2157 domain-containing protein [Ideonella sp.]|nr:DUF2157 domain-containing protein [Ideonella sp.]
MAQPRAEILEWAEQGRIAPGALCRALELAAVLPGAADWRRFLDRLMLFMGATMLAAGVVFFFAYNWQDLGRLAKLGLAQLPIVAALVLVGRLGLERVAGKAALLAAALFVGALLALIGQVYQTGADTFELFAAWAIAILPWVLLARFAALWIVWLALANLAVMLYFQAFRGLLGLAFGPERQLWVAFALNSAAAAIWEACAALGVRWLRERWAARLVATASGGTVTALAVMAIVEWHASGGNLVAWLAWLGVAYAVYRHLVKDVYVLALGALSVITVVATFLGKRLSFNDAGALLFTGLVVIALSAAAGYWLRRVAAAQDA